MIKKFSSQIPEYEYGNVIVSTNNIKNIDEWEIYYEYELLQMYSITRDTFNRNYPENNVNWDSNDVFNNFVKLIYHCSSKNVPKYI